MSDHRTSEDYALWRYVEDADQIVEQLGWQRHAIIGHSMGGAISTLYAGLYESRYVTRHPIASSPPK
jgi:pimeloyl-ACP methyl ester carboxylesterase